MDIQKVVLGQRVNVERFNQRDTGVVSGVCYRAIKGAGGQVIEHGELLGFDIASDRGFRYYAQAEQMEVAA